MNACMNAFSMVLAAAALASLALPAQAQVDFYRRTLPPQASQGGALGLALIAGRQYQGSDESRLMLLPNVEYQWRNGFFAGALNGLGYNASARPELAYGVRITPSFGRKEHRSDALRGLGDIPLRPELGAFLNVQPLRGLSLNSSLRHGSGSDRQGLLLDLGASWSLPLGPGLRLGTSLAATWANAAYQQDYFGVDAAQAQRSGYAAYTPSAGLRDVRVGASLTHRLSPDWSLTGSLSRSELQGDARRSPLVRETATISALVVLGYSF